MSDIETVHEKLDEILMALKEIQRVQLLQGEAHQKLTDHIDFIENVYESVSTKMGRFNLFPALPKKLKND